MPDAARLSLIDAVTPSQQEWLQMTISEQRTDHPARAFTTGWHARRHPCPFPVLGMSSQVRTLLSEMTTDTGAAFGDSRAHAVHCRQHTRRKGEPPA
ncbi:hypothetical protein [Streptomyces sp. NPDC090083]|uniref:hypothetical protein n=1 Tax=Streptomyces sp. NPDC090083 TaxID=3365941 RepID=UPI00380F9228